MEFAWVNIFEVRGGRFVRGRIYTELMREAGGIEDGRWHVLETL